MRRTKTYITALVTLLAFSACEDEKNLSPDDANCAYIYAEIVGQKETINRGALDKENGTYTAFEAGDKVGIYALGPLYNKTGNNDTPVKNTEFKLGTNGRWQENAQLIWDSDLFGKVEVADIYGYYPYKTHTDSENVYKNGGYSIFKEANKLEDVLMAERTTVQYDNPAIFLTFKHRFALLKIKLGTGMEGSPTTARAVSAIMNLGIEEDAKIDNLELGQMRLTGKDDGINEFKPIVVSGGYYYVIVPVEGPAEKDPENHFVSDSLKVVAINVDGQPSPLGNEFAPRMNTIYNLIVHKGEQGSVSVVMGGIEEWGGDRYLSNVREEGGVYWASDLKELQNILNDIAKKGRVPDESDADLTHYGKWDEDKQCFIFPIMRNIDMNDFANDNRNCCITDFYGILDGRGHTINGLDITGPGLIGTLHEKAEIRNLELKNTTVNKGTSNVDGTGALVGFAKDKTTIFNCSVTGTSAVTGGNNTGGLVGKGNPTMDRCSSNADVSGGSNTGGLIGSLTAGGSIDQSYTTGTITSTGNNVGGMVGSAEGSIANSHAGCDVTGKNNVGGLVGSTTGSIDDCTATGYIKGNDIIGGLAGTTTSTVNKCGANGTVTGTGIVGGLIGKHDVSGDKVIEITGSYARSDIENGITMGGLIGTTTLPYKPEVKEVEAKEEQWIYYDNDGNEVSADSEDMDPEKTVYIPAVIGVEYEAPKGTEVINCYATNGKVLIYNTNDGISYSYQIGTTTNDGGTNAAYTISLTPNPPVNDELESIITALNNGSFTGSWVKGLVIIDSKSYTLPVLNYK